MPHRSHSPIELLSPAKNAEAGIAAIDCGADAVYIGAERFGARKAAGNTIEDIGRLCEYAHKLWARVYVTVNTILRDDEIDDAVALIRAVHSIGADAVIIQDAGLLECDLPPLPLIASTQMHNHTPDRVAFLEKVGFTRAILARELSLEQIQAIRRATSSIELECFVHGALCVCYSGQCYLSYVLGGRSGNRGECAQPCRRAWTLADATGAVIARNKHLLSLKDLNLSEHLGALIDAGVTSFKIEGRLKDVDYVRNVVAFYRQKLDEVMRAKGLHRSSSGVSAHDFTPDPAKTFNRGYASYFIRGGRAVVGSIDTPKSLGERIGVVTAVHRTSFEIDTVATLRSGDGLCYFDSNRDLCGTTVNAVHGAQVAPDKLLGINVGTEIRRNYDHAFAKHLDRTKTQRLLGVALTLEETVDGFALIARDEDGVIACHALACAHTPADNPAAAAARIEQQLAKCGGTVFSCSIVTLALDAIWFIPVATLNALRRGVLEDLVRARIARRPVATGGAKVNDVPYPAVQLDYRGNVLNRKAAAFYRRHGVGDIGRAAEAGVRLPGQQVMRTKYCIRHQLGLCVKEGGGGKYTEPLYLVADDGTRLKLAFDCAACEMDVMLA